ncbi:hypothetical protein RKD38_004665 [Streptomyces ambofaciens]
MEKEELPAGGALARADAGERQQGHPDQGDEVSSAEGEPAEFVEERGHEGVLPVRSWIFRAGGIGPTT